MIRYTVEEGEKERQANLEKDGGDRGREEPRKHKDNESRTSKV